MRRWFAKLAFAHRRLWQRDTTYRGAVLLGPPPLVGGIIAAAIWFGAPELRQSRTEVNAPPPWATVTQQVVPNSSEPRAVAPGMSLPAPGPQGIPVGFATGWQGGIHAVELNATMNVTVLPTRLDPLTFEDTSLELGQIISAGSATGRFVGVGTASLAIRTPGMYAIALRIERDDADPATCLERLAFAGQTVVNNLNIDLSGPKVVTFEPATFMLQPGLYPIGAAFGCWRDTKDGGVGKVTVLIRHPNEDELRAARPDEILRAVSGR